MIDHTSKHWREGYCDAVLDIMREMGLLELGEYQEQIEALKAESSSNTRAIAYEALECFKGALYGPSSWRQE